MNARSRPIAASIARYLNSADPGLVKAIPSIIASADAMITDRTKA